MNLHVLGLIPNVSQARHVSAIASRADHGGHLAIGEAILWLANLSAARYQHSTECGTCRAVRDARAS